MTDQLTHQPATASPAAVAHLAAPTPYLALDLGRVVVAYESLRAALPSAYIHYAMKANPEPQLLRTINSLGGGYVIASAGEMDLLRTLQIPASGVLYSNPVKPSSHIARAYAAGVRRFVVDTEAEADKVAQKAPGSAICVRLHTAPAASAVPSEGKFGVPPDRAARIMRHAARLGLLPYGLTFHVGSQQTRPEAWSTAIGRAGEVMDQLARSGIAIEFLDLGGGFPLQYADPDPVPAIITIGERITQALTTLPYPVQTAIEPGRYLAGPAGMLVTTVLGIADRPGGRWLHLDAGAFHGFMEALETGGTLRFPVTDSRGSDTTQTVHLTGPTCDSQDTIMLNAEVSADLEVGDHVYFHSAGAYTTCYAGGEFNGFPAPQIHLTKLTT
jgi:ornithine decarboxylase